MCQSFRNPKPILYSIYSSCQCAWQYSTTKRTCGALLKMLQLHKNESVTAYSPTACHGGLDLHCSYNSGYGELSLKSSLARFYIVQHRTAKSKNLMRIKSWTCGLIMISLGLSSCTADRSHKPTKHYRQ